MPFATGDARAFKTEMLFHTLCCGRAGEKADALGAAIAELSAGSARAVPSPSVVLQRSRDTIFGEVNFSAAFSSAADVRDCMSPGWGAFADVELVTASVLSDFAR